MSMRNIKVEKNSCTFELYGKYESFPNSLRRALLNNIKNYAPDRVVFRKNTSCQTDEYIAHRICMIPFRANNLCENLDLKPMTCKIEGKTPYSHDLTGDGFTCSPDIPIMKLSEEQALDFDVYFKRGCGLDHAKFSHVGKVGYKQTEKSTQISFETISDIDSPVEMLMAAVDSLMSDVRDTIHLVETKYDDIKEDA